ncbi:3-mercaptopyruvate sulfurtransferase [Octopus bimaculoides]|uniref:Rhodanese domain-containing protein n=1 Tax=Octopus bimaculoides TaxID=37653 RepID=A0A0L8H9S3_OCTBM|nr:3-mercaptopyruvate sulfurtransferase [Octopus bimaculoides]|eukprot:XP_014774610.1 PREDICTED: 3-mercaptopyruvate sulfurtransferase-like [Octopus bimaculoides]
MRITKIGTLVSTNWLKDCLSSSSADKLRVLDVSWARLQKPGVGYDKFYKKQHIPGSIYFDLNQCSTPTKHLPYDLPDTNCLSEYIGNLGISNKNYIIVYDQQNNSSAFRAWWMFKYLGHSDVSMLDGGMSKWIADNYEVTAKPTTYEKCNFEINLEPKRFRSFEEIAKNLETQTEKVVDCRPSQAFHGNPQDKLGHIPHSKNLPYSTLFKPDGTMKSKAELKDLFTASGVSLGKPLICTCQTGVTACGVAAAAEMLGKEEITVYLGSWHEWSQRADSKQII